jgi:hypothetical protein
MYRTFYRYDRIKIRSLPPGYHDRDTMYLHACFQLLVDWVEREKGLEWWSPEGVQQQTVYADLKRLYEWWTLERPKRDEAREGLWEDPAYDPANGSTIIDLENTHEGEDQRNLELLTRLRGYLWT